MNDTVLDIPAIISRVVAAPHDHLGRKSLQLLRSYLFGYDDACRALDLPPPHDPLAREQFQQWVQRRIEMTAEHRSRLNAWSCVCPYSYSQLISTNNSAALDTYLELRELAANELGATTVTVTHSDSASPKPPLLGLLPEIHKRPAMYFGNNWTLSDLWAFFRGYLWCERDHGMELSENFRILTGFQEWMEQRYPFGRGITWDRILHFLSMGSPQGSFDSFMEHLGMFRAGAPPTAPDPTMVQMIANIKKHIQLQKDARAETQGSGDPGE